MSPSSKGPTDNRRAAARQPSTRTAEPRTFDLSPTQCPHCWHVHMDYNDEACVSCGCEYAIRDMAAAPAGLDEKMLALVFAGITFSEWADAQGDTTRLFDLTRHVAAEYDHLLRQRGER